MLDIQAAIGIHQLTRLPEFVARRAQIAARYREALAELPGVLVPPEAPPDSRHSWHLFVVKILPEVVSGSRDEFRAQLKARNIGTGLHFRAVHLHPYFARVLPYPTGSLPNAEWASDRVVSLPLFPLMSDEDVEDVVTAIREIVVR